MEQSTIDALMTLAMMLLFIALVASAFTGSRKASEDAARLPFDDEDEVASTTPPGETARH